MCFHKGHYTVNDLSLYLMDSSVDSSLATEGFPEDVCQSKLSPNMSELLIFNDVTLCVRCQRSLGVKRKKAPERGQPYERIRENSIKHHIHPSFHGYGADTNTVAFFPPAVSPCGNRGCFTGKTNARSCVLSEPAATVARSPAPRRAAIQQLNGAG